MEDSAVQKSGRHQPPPLAGANRRPELGAEGKQRFHVEIDEIAAPAIHAKKRRSEVQAGVDQQDDDGVEARLRNEAAEDRSGTGTLYALWRHGLVAVRTDAVLRRDKGPAVRAHAARFHFNHHNRYPLSTIRLRLAATSFEFMPPDR